MGNSHPSPSPQVEQEPQPKRIEELVSPEANKGLEKVEVQADGSRPSTQKLSGEQAQDAVHSELDKTLVVTEDVLEDSKLRYAAYANRIRTALVASSRYLAYTSDFGEAFRPVVHKNFVRAAYGISWVYVAGDVAVETMRERERGSDNNIVARTFTKRALFQSTASMILPMFFVHQTVHVAAAVMKKFGGTNRWIPTIAGLAVIPALPYLFDHPVEYALDKTFDTVWPVPGEHLGHSTHNEQKPNVE
ncbi:mitochondrial fission protein [Acrasis kona]|uniref:Mitochondrial fission process protein 1 n=1 Tax=Acrasis kona TaxID=1008807 RepID=A0AAW2ZA83_9EUKA